MKRILPLIVISQFCCTSVWFAGNAIIKDIAVDFQLSESFLAHLTSSVQLGFITGTFLFAVLSIADRISPSKVFFFSSIMAALFNFAITWKNNDVVALLSFRFLTGFFLAGIYPVGMKIAADYYEKGLGRSLGFLVGALVLGTAFPHLVKSYTLSLPWKLVIYSTSLLSVIGGLLIVTLVPNGPFRKAGQQPSLIAFVSGFRSKPFRSAALGYFGHMWELYAFWTFIPVILSLYRDQITQNGLNISLLSFCIIAIGTLSCIASGYLSLYYGEKKIAGVALSVSGGCCLLSPLIIAGGNLLLFLVFLLVWGIAVIADSPLFSTMVARTAPPQSKGASLTIVNSIGFAITILSIQLVNYLMNIVAPQYIFLVLAAGPIIGLIGLYCEILFRIHSK